MNTKTRLPPEAEIIIFGASGDLTSRKLIPAILRLYERGAISEKTKVVGVARTAQSSESWRGELSRAMADTLKNPTTAATWQRAQNNIHYFVGDITDRNSLSKLDAELNAMNAIDRVNRVYYLSTSPTIYEAAVSNLGLCGMADEVRGQRRVIVEKPFGTDLETAHRLNRAIHQVFQEKQVFRIDHYLGKETVQNLFVLRFGNAIFEPLWNRHYIDYVEITVAEEGLVGRRGGYYDSAGVLRDMFQNHLLQLLMIVAMESPARFDAELIRDEKVKVLQAVRPIREADLADCGMRGQYDGYRSEPGVAADSQTETFAALRLFVDNWRWKGVPFYLRSGKGMSCRTTQIVIRFREAPHLLFNGGEQCPEGNKLVIQIQPAEGIQLHFQAKVPNENMAMRNAELEFRFDRKSSVMPEAYERLLLDALHGDASLFTRSDEVELAWQIMDPIIKGWSNGISPLYQYEPGYWGPKECGDWIARDNRSWFDTCPVL